MFWGLSLKANKKYSQKVSKPFHVSQAALDIANSGDEPVQAVLSWEGNNYILCTLRKELTEQVPLDLNFAEGDEISFTSQGNGNIHLVGYFIVDADDYAEEITSESDSSEEISLENSFASTEPIEKPKPTKKKKIKNDAGEGARKRQGSEENVEPPRKVAALETVEKSQENGNVSKKDKKRKVSAEVAERKLSGGVRVEDVLVGSGKEARQGAKVLVYYEGRLQSNNKVFDSTKQGAGFKFALGRGEVIRGWDIGIQGMKVGGKRKIVCPPNMAYGASGSPPVIPPNSTLIFDVELRAVQ